MPSPRHLVERVRFDLAVHSRALGVSVQERLSAFQRERLASIMNECIDTVLDANEHVSIPRLDLDLGDVSLEHLEHEVESRLRRELMGALQRARSNATRERFVRTARRVTGPTAAERLIEYVSDGRLDWTLQGTAVDLDALLQAAMDDPSTSSRTLARQLVMTRAGRRRLAQQFSRVSRRRVAAALRELRNAPHTIMPDEWDESDRTDGRGIVSLERAGVPRLRDDRWTSNDRPPDAVGAAVDDSAGVQAILTTGDVPVEWLARTSPRHLVALLSGGRVRATGATRSAVESVPGAEPPVLSVAAAERLAETLVRHVPWGLLLALLRRRQPQWRTMVRASLRAARASSREPSRAAWLWSEQGAREGAAYATTAGPRAIMRQLLIASLTHARSASAGEMSAATTGRAHRDDASTQPATGATSGTTSPIPPASEHASDAWPGDPLRRVVADDRLAPPSSDGPENRERVQSVEQVQEVDRVEDVERLGELALHDARGNPRADALVSPPPSQRSTASNVDVLDPPDDRPGEASQVGGRPHRVHRRRDPLLRLRRLLQYGVTNTSTLGERVASLERRLALARHARWHDWQALARMVASDAVMRARLLAWCSESFSTQLLADAGSEAEGARGHHEPTSRADNVASGIVSVADVLAFLEHGSLPPAESRRLLIRASTWAWMRDVLRSRERDTLLHAMRASDHAAQIATSLERTLPARHLERVVQLLMPGLSGFAVSYRRAAQRALTQAPRTSRATTLRAVWRSILQYALVTPRDEASAHGMVAAIVERVSPASMDERRAHLERVRATARRLAAHAPRYFVLDDVASGVLATLSAPSESTIDGQLDATAESWLPPVIDSAAPHDVAGSAANGHTIDATPTAASPATPGAGEGAATRGVPSSPHARDDRDALRRLAQRLRFGRTSVALDSVGARRIEAAVRRTRHRFPDAWSALAHAIVSNPLSRARLASEFSLTLTVAVFDAVHEHRAAYEHGAAHAHTHDSERERQRRIHLFCEHLAALLAADESAHASVPTHAMRWWRRLVQESLLQAAGDHVAASVAHDAPLRVHERAPTRAFTPAAQRDPGTSAVSLPHATLRGIVRRAVEQAAKVRELSTLELSTRLRARAWFRAARSAEHAGRRGAGRGMDHTSGFADERADQRAAERAAAHAVERELADTLDARAGDESRTPTRFAPLRTGPASRPDDGAPIHVDDAGLVILWPMFSHFFSQLQLADKGTFVDAAAAERAVLLLRHLVTGESEAPEPLLSLDKLLCGVPWGTPVPRRIVLTDQERELSTELLTVVTQRWTPLANTSIAGLRESFLQREGRLVPHGDMWQLTVATRAYDMLLDRLPWNLSPVRLPWMPALLHVRWRP